MKHILTTIILVLGLTITMSAQQEVITPTEVSKAVYFDVSPPLRDIPVIAAGKRDRSWKDGVVKNKLGTPEMRDLPLPEATPEDYINAQTSNGNRSSELLLSVNGVSNLSFVLPPDTQGDVGPNHYMQMVNSSFAIWNKTGSVVYGPVDIRTLWNGFPGPWSGSNDGDPVVLYDEQADRWIASQFALPNYPNGPFYEMIAVSQTGDPTGAWYRYAFTFTNMPDYPKLGVWHDGYYLSVNSFTSGSLNYNGTGVAALERDKMLVGDPSASMILFTTSAGADPYSFLPADCDGEPAPADSPALFGYIRDGNPDRLVLYKLDTDWTTPSNATFTQLVSLPVQSFSSNISGIPQKNTSVKLDELSGRLMYRLQYRNFGSYQTMVTNQTVNVAGHAGVCWYELRNSGSGWQVYQQGTYSPDDTYRWMGSAAMNAYGDIALGYSASSSSLFPSIRFTGRHANDPLGEMTIAEQDIVAGGGSQTSSWERWGDYSMMSVDPSADSVFWYTQEYYTSTSEMNWKTRIGSFTFGVPMVAVATASPTIVCAGESVQLNAEVTGGSGSFVYSWTSVPGSFTSNLPNPVVIPEVTTQYNLTITSGNSTATASVTVTVNPLPSITVSNDMSACQGSVVRVVANATDISSLLWTTQGDGTFLDPTDSRADYTPGPQDILAGSVTLTATALSAFGCSPDDDSLILTIIASPVAEAGPTLATCGNEPVQLSGIATGNSSVLWTSAGDGSFVNANLSNAVYTPGAGDVLAGSVNLTFTAIGNAPCADTSDVVTVNIVTAASMEAGSDITICANDLVPLSATGDSYSSVLWSTSGTGHFDNSTILNPLYSPSQDDISEGQIILSISAAGIGSCPGITDQLQLNINPLPMATAGNDTTICKTSSLIVKGTVTNATSSFWSTSGNGTFADPSLLVTTYLPGTQDTIQGSVTLSLTADSQFDCGEIVSSKEVLFAACLGLETPGKATLKIMPNPTRGKFSVEIDGLPDNLNFELSVTDAKSKQVIDGRYQSNGGQFKVMLDLTSQPKGIYLLRISSGSEITTAKIILQ
ncbi:MAG: T9SS type A sorting domain-containing protein [Bacteroidota bacterium]